MCNTILKSLFLLGDAPRPEEKEDPDTVVDEEAVEEGAVQAAVEAPTPGIRLYKSSYIHTYISFVTIQQNSHSKTTFGSTFFFIL